LVVLI